MTASAVVQVMDGEGSWVGTTNGVNVTHGNTISIRLASSSEVSQWTLQIFGVDEVTGVAPALSGVDPETHIVSDPTGTVTFVIPAGAGIGRALVFRSMVNGGGAGQVSNFGIYTLTEQGFRVGAVGEKFEGDPSFGWAVTVNTLIRAGGSGGGGLPPTSGEQYSVLMEDPAGVLKFGRLSQEMIIPAFAITSWAKTNYGGSSTLCRIGDSFTGITASAGFTSGPPVTANVSMVFSGSTSPSDIKTGIWVGVSPFTNWTMSGVLQLFGDDVGANPSVAVTLNATKNGVTHTSTWSLQWVPDVWWGVGSAGMSTEAAVKALAGTALQATRARSFTVSPSNQKVYYALPKMLGSATFTLNGFPAAFNSPTEIQLTNVNGVTRTYNIYESTNLLTGTNLVFVVN